MKNDLERLQDWANRVNNCKNAINHTLGPPDYSEWREWADDMSRTHVQTQCPECGGWFIWTKKEQPE